MRGIRLYAIVDAAFMAGAFIASPELRAYAANTVFSTDIKDGEVKTPDLANNAVTAAKIKDGEVKTAEIATDAVGGAELSMVTKLIFGQCVLTNTEATTVISAGSFLSKNCNISGVDADDSASVTLYGGNDNNCFDERIVLAETDRVVVGLRNECSGSEVVGPNSKIAVIVFDK